MLSAIFDGISAIGNFFSSVFSFVGMLLSSLIDFISMLAQIPSLLPAMFSWLPGTIVSAVIAVIMIAIVYKMLGRE